MEAKDLMGIPPALLDRRDDEKGKLSLLVEEEEEEEEEMLLDIEEDVVEEMIRWLEREISGAGAVSSPGAGCGESCGASFSDSTSTVMASVDTRGAMGGGDTPFFWPPQLQPPASGCGSPEGGGVPWEIMRRVEGKEEVGDGEEEEWLSRVLRGTEMELGSVDADGGFLL